MAKGSFLIEVQYDEDSFTFIDKERGNAFVSFDMGSAFRAIQIGHFYDPTGVWAYFLGYLSNSRKMDGPILKDNPPRPGEKED